MQKEGGKVISKFEHKRCSLAEASMCVRCRNKDLTVVLCNQTESLQDYSSWHIFYYLSVIQTGQLTAGRCYTKLVVHNTQP